MTWPLEAATEHIRAAGASYAEAARQQRVLCEAALDAPPWWPHGADHSHAALKARVERCERAHALATSCLAALEEIRELAAEDAAAEAAAA